jgi:hypothetical protein
MTVETSGDALHLEEVTARISALKWARRWLVLAGVGSMCCVGLSILVIAGLIRGTAWKPELLRTGVHTTGEITDVHQANGRGDSNRITVLVTSPIQFVASIDDPTELRRYRVGQPVDIWFDPGRQSHARTKWDSSSDGSEDAGGWVLAALSGASLAAFARLRTAVLLCWRLRRRSPVTSIARVGWTGHGRANRTLIEVDDHLFAVLRDVEPPALKWVAGSGRTRAVFGSAAGEGVSERSGVRPHLFRRPFLRSVERHWYRSGRTSWAGELNASRRHRRR